VHDVAILAAKGLAGGTLVCLFAVLSELVEPKRFAGLFSAAPAVAIAGLAITLLDKGAHDGRDSAIGMMAGAAAMAVYAAVVVLLLRRRSALVGSLSALVVWLACAALIAWPLLA